MGGLARRGGSMQDRFGRELLDRFRASPAVAESWYSAQRFAIGYRRSVSDPASWAYLGNLYAECACLAGARRAERLSWYVATMTEPATMPADWATAAPLLRPVLAGSAFGRPVLGAAADGRAELVRRAALPMLDELVVVDLPSTIGYVTAELVADWQVPVSQVFATARANLAADVRRTHNGPVSTREPRMLRFVDDGEAYWVSRLLTEGWLAGLSELVGGRPVAFAPDRDCLVVVRDGTQLPGIFEIAAAEYQEAVRPVSPMAYTVDNAGRIVPYHAPPGHPAHLAATRAERLLAGTAYDAQAELLRDAWEPARAGRLTVASYLVAEPEGQSSVSVSTWLEDAATLLPVTDRVAMVSRDRRQSWLVRWEALVAALEPQPVPGLVPSRYQVGRWPRGEQRRVMLAAATHRRDGADG
ncbi:MAG: hypothetical protein WCA46_20090 [Actinocatenispora sp.]